MFLIAVVIGRYIVTSNGVSVPPKETEITGLGDINMVMYVIAKVKASCPQKYRGVVHTLLTASYLCLR